MKKYLLAFAFTAFVTGLSIAQTETTPTTTDSTNTSDSIKLTEQPQIIIPKVNTRHTTPYYQTYQPFMTSANTTANMYPTVNATVGGGVSIKGGREENNAYFFNGVRVMDNLPRMKMPNPKIDIK